LWFEVDGTLVKYDEEDYAMKAQVLMNGNKDSLLKYLTVMLAMALFSVAAAAQTTPATEPVSALTVKEKTPATTANSGPAMKAFRNVAIGMPADAVKDAFGRPKLEDKDGFLFELSDDETAQVRVDPDMKLRTLAITFMKGKNAPSFTEVFGTGIEIKPQADGSVYHMQRYPAEGYWISYFRAAGDDGIVTLTFQKL
jgi:hypothetical protein